MLKKMHRWVHGLLGAAEKRPAFRMLVPTLDALDTLLARPAEVTSGAPHIRSHWDLKRYMISVVLALVPCALAGIYLFGWRVAAVIAVSYAFGLATEGIVAGIKGTKLTEGAFVTCMLFPLTLPPTVPLWMVAVGIVFAILVVKELFGGTGYNWFNPALAARAFIYILFYNRMAGAVWPMPYRGGIGGFGHWLWNGAEQGIDALTAATAASAWKVAPGEPMTFTLWEMFMGVIPGSIGESQKIFILAALVFLVGTRVADWRLVLSPFIGAVGMSTILHFATGGFAPPPHMAVFAGSLLFGATFMITDPVTAPKLAPSKWVYGICIGVIAILIRVYAPIPQGLMISILIMNPCSRLIDRLFRARVYRKRREAVGGRLAGPVAPASGAGR